MIRIDIKMADNLTTTVYTIELIETDNIYERISETIMKDRVFIHSKNVILKYPKHLIFLLLIKEAIKKPIYQYHIQRIISNYYKAI